MGPATNQQGGYQAEPTGWGKEQPAGYAEAILSEPSRPVGIYGLLEEFVKNREDISEEKVDVLIDFCDGLQRDLKQWKHSKRDGGTAGRVGARVRRLAKGVPVAGEPPDFQKPSGLQIRALKF